jgi:hypothetical protein
MMNHDASVQEVLIDLARPAQQERLTNWERGFVANVSRQMFPLTDPQRATLVKLAEEYCDPLLAAELRGQLRLLV